MQYQNSTYKNREELFSARLWTAAPQLLPQSRKLNFKIVATRFSFRSKGLSVPFPRIYSYEKSKEICSNESPFSRGHPQGNPEKGRQAGNIFQLFGFGFDGYRTEKPALTSFTSSEFSTFPSFSTRLEIFLYKSTGNLTVVVMVAGPFFLPLLLFFESITLYAPPEKGPNIPQSGTFCQIINNHLIASINLLEVNYV